MATHHHLRQPHRALMKKRYRPAHIPPGLHGLDLGSRGSGGKLGRGEGFQPALGARQLDGLPTNIPTPAGFTIPDTDLYPPTLPTQADTPDPVTNTTSSTATPSATTSSPTTTTTPAIAASTTNAPVPTTSSTPQPAPVAPTSSTSLSSQAVAAGLTQMDEATVTITSSITHSSASATAGKAESTSLATPSSTSSQGVIIGGIVTGVIAIAVLALAVVWFMRRRKRGNGDDQTFDPADFRRSALLLDDKADGSAITTLGRGLGSNSNNYSAHNGNSASPRPPSMIERKLAHEASGYSAGYSPSEVFAGATYASTHGHGEYGAPHQHYGGGEAGAYYNQGYEHHSPYPHPSQQAYQPYPLGQTSVEQNVNPFTTPVQQQPYSAQMQPSPFSLPMAQEQPLRSPSPDTAAAAVLAQVGGTPVLTRSVSARSGPSAKSTKLSISIPAVDMSAMVVNGSAESSAGSGEGPEYPVLKRYGSVTSRSSSMRRNGSSRATTPTAVMPPLPTQDRLLAEGNDGAVEYPVLKRYGSVSSRSNSMRRKGSLKTPATPVRPPLPPPLPEGMAELRTGDYVDLARSSVTPFQAAQYAEISKRLNAEVPQGLSSLAIEEAMSRDRDLPPLPPPSPLPVPSADRNQDQDEEDMGSPFADPSESDHHQTEARSSMESNDSKSSDPDVGAKDLLDFPIPPPSPFPSHNHSDSTSSSIFEPPPPLPGLAKPRINSFPPQLPEINVETSSRLSMDSKFDNDKHESSYMNTGLGLGSAKGSPIYPSGITAGGSPLLGNRFPVTPSPLGQSFVLDTPQVSKGVFGQQQQQQGANVLVVTSMEQRKRKEGAVTTKKEEPEMMYDLEDAYGGM